MLQIGDLLSKFELTELIAIGPWIFALYALFLEGLHIPTGFLPAGGPYNAN
jgi:hypothetical protein